MGLIFMSKNAISNRVHDLRTLMHEIKADYYFVPATDPHRNEYLPECFERRAWITGFTGSAGDAVIGKNDAYLWTDPRYFLQAEQQLDPALYQLMKQGQGETPAIDRWLSNQKKPLVFAVDPKIISINQAARIETALQEHGGKLLSVENNLIDQLWKDRPSMPHTPIRIHGEQFAGESAEKKLQALRTTMIAEGVNAIVITVLDAIAWLFNIRGNDIAYNPLIISYAIVTLETATLFVDLDKVTPNDQRYLETIPVAAAPYEDFKAALNAEKGHVWVDPNTASLWVKQELREATLFLADSPITLMKAIKNPIEQAGARKAHEIDAIAMIEFLYWLEHNWRSGVSELQAAEQLSKFRRQDPRCLDLSFSTISGFGPHGAIVHYFVTEKSSIDITDQSLYLIDSGGQYATGTTDITRTIHLGSPTIIQKHHYTLVLKGHLALRHAIFPQGTRGEHLNAFAHQFLWNEALDFGHGTGHGVGSYLCVHEGPQAITARNTGVPLMPGMIVSNEPGVYLTNQYGIRIENLCLITEKYDIKESATSHGPFYTLDDLTLVPYCRQLINKEELSKQEIQWVNEYHQRIFKTLAPQLSNQNLMHWLAEATAPL